MFSIQSFKKKELLDQEKKGEVYKKFKFKDLLLGLSFPQVSGVIASFLIAYMVGVYAPIGIFQQPSTWTLVKQNYKAVNDNISESNVREWQVQDEGVLLSLKAIPGLDVSKSIYLDNNGVITQGYKVALFIKSSKSIGRLGANLRNAWAIFKTSFKIAFGPSVAAMYFSAFGNAHG